MNCKQVKFHTGKQTFLFEKINGILYKTMFICACINILVVVILSHNWVDFAFLFVCLFLFIFFVSRF